MTVLVNDAGYAQDDVPAEAFVAFEALASGEAALNPGAAVDFPNDRDPADLAPYLDRLSIIRVAFPAMTDGRGFSVASRLRAMGYTGRLRAKGPLIADQYRAARRTGFDEVEIPDESAARQPETAWVNSPARPDYRARLTGAAS